jgi:hypothetical protein
MLKAFSNTGSTLYVGAPTGTANLLTFPPHWLRPKGEHVLPAVELKKTAVGKPQSRSCTQTDTRSSMPQAVYELVIGTVTLLEESG